MKWLISTLTIVCISIGSPVVPAASSIATLKPEVLTMQEMARQANLNYKQSINTAKVNSVIKKLKKTVGKTPYVFSGSTPYGWDCSGMVMWAYAKLGIDLRHSASSQKNSGKFVKSPKPGDIVAFGWSGWKGAQHVGIYLGNGKMIHAGGQGDRTSVISVSKWAKMNGNTKVTYTRLISVS
jgi:cell wall-associated NlpC family hydrolase